MRKAKLITGLVIEEVNLFHGDEIRYVSHVGQPTLTTDGYWLNSKEESRVAPVVKIFSDYGRKQLYVALTKEVEDLLRVPFSTIYRELNESRAALKSAEFEQSRLRREIERIGNLSILKRLKFLFTRKPQ